MNQTCDTIVVGGGPAGAATALRLARTGRRVTLLDVATFPRQKVCGEYLPAAAWQLLGELGLGYLRERAARFDRLQIVTPGRAPIDVALDASSAQTPAGLSRWTLDAALVRAAAAAGVEVRTGYRVREVNVRAGAIENVVASAVDRTDDRLVLSAPEVIAADGRNSIVVRQTGRVARRGPESVGYKRHFAAGSDEPIPPGAISMFALPGTYLGVCRVDSGAINVCGLMSRRVLRAFHGDVGAALASIASDHTELGRWLARAEPLGPWHTVPEVVRQRAWPTIPGVLYVGDCAGTIEPLTGQGMTMALSSAALAAELLGESHGIDRALQERYQARWDEAFAGTIARAAWFGRAMRHPRALAGLLAIGPVREHFAPGFVATVRGWLSV